MRQSLSEFTVAPDDGDRGSGLPGITTDAEIRRTSSLGVVATLSLGLLLTVITLIALIIDQASVHTLADHVDAHYAPFGLHPDPNLLFGFLYVTELIGILLWLTMIWSVRRGKRWARVVASMILVVATSIALLVLFVSEFGTPIFPPGWGILGLLPCAAGLVAVSLMWTS